MFDMLAATSLTYKERQNKKVLLSPVPQMMPQDARCVQSLWLECTLHVLVTPYSILLTPSRCNLLGADFILI